jgi:hypothetical protein
MDLAHEIAAYVAFGRPERAELLRKMRLEASGR